MMSEAKFDCTSTCDKDIVLDALQKCFCRGCVRHCCQKLCGIYEFNFFFNLIFLYFCI